MRVSVEEEAERCDKAAPPVFLLEVIYIRQLKSGLLSTRTMVFEGCHPLECMIRASMFRPW